MKYLVKNWFMFACSLFIGAGIFARIFIIGFPFEYDEIFTAVATNPVLPLPLIIQLYLLPDVHPPLHYVFLWLYNHIVPYGAEWLLRLPSVVAGLISLWVGWKMFPLRFGKEARWTFMALISLNYFLLFFSQQARPYAFLFLESLIFTFLFLQILHRFFQKQPITWHLWVPYALCAVLLTWTHYFGGVLLGIVSGLVCVVAFYYKRDIWKFLLIAIGTFASFWVWLIPQLQANVAQARFSGGWWANSLDRGQIWYGLESVLFENRYLYIVFMLLAIVGLIYWARQYRQNQKRPFTREIVFLILCCVGVWAVSAFCYLVLGMYFFLGRYFIVIVPAFYLAYTLIVVPLFRWRWAKILFVVLCLLSGGYNIPAAWFTQYMPGNFYRDFSEFYRDNYADKDLYVISITPFPALAKVPMYSFYLNLRFGMHIKVYELVNLTDARRDELLDRREHAVIFVHNCNMTHLNLLSQLWNRSFVIEGRARGSCTVRLSDKGKNDPETMR